MCAHQPFLFLHIPLYRHAMESTYAKASLGTVPSLPVADVNKNRAEIKEFKALFRAKCHESILECYHACNRKGWTIVRSHANGGLAVLLPCCHSGDLCRPASGHQMHPNWLRVSCLLHLPKSNGRTPAAFCQNANRREYARPPEASSEVQRPTRRRRGK